MPVTVNNYGLIYNSDMCVTIRPDDVPFAGVKSILVEQGTTNLILTQTSGVQDWSKWSHWNNSTYWYSCTQYDVPFYGKVFEGVAKDKTYLYYYYPFTVTAGTTYTLSVYLKADRVVTNKQLRGYMTRSSDNAVIALHIKIVTITTEWQRFDFQLTPTESRTNSAGIGFEFASSNYGIRYYLLLPQLEALPFATSFVNGSRSDGRYVILTDLAVREFATKGVVISLWAKRNSVIQSSTELRIFSCTENGGFNIEKYAGGNLRLSINDNGTYKLANFSNQNIFNDLAWHHVCFIYNLQTKVLSVYVDLQLMASTQLQTGLYFNQANTYLLALGHEWPNGLQWNGLLADIYIGYPYASGTLVWTEDFIKKIYNARKPFRYN